MCVSLCVYDRERHTGGEGERAVPINEWVFFSKALWCTMVDKKILDKHIKTVQYIAAIFHTS